MNAISEVRAFNRHWTEVLGLLDESLLATEFSLAEARVIFELAGRKKWERLELRQRLRIDASFLTRVLARLEQRKLVVSEPSTTDGRALDVALTSLGRVAFKDLNRRSAQQIRELLAPLTPDEVATMAESMAVIRELTKGTGTARLVALRPIGTGDLGWVVQRHGALYADEFGWNIEFEALVARIVADYQTDLKVGRENAWIATVDGARAGCIFCVQKGADTAQLRILLVESWARGLGIGTRLVEQCVSFARDAGYTSLTLWTNDILVAARRIYESVGFVLVDQQPHHSFGKDLVGQTWTLHVTADDAAKSTHVASIDPDQ